MTAANTISKLFFSILALCASVGAANATTVTGTLNAAWYKTISLNVATASNVDMQYLSGYEDPFFMLFNDTGHHLISADDDDDSFSLFPHLTQTLNAGNYTLLVTDSYGGLNALDGFAASYSITDGFNAGSYQIGGLATLSSVKTSLNGEPNPYLNSTQFSIELTNATLNPASVPEPQSVALFGLALTALALARRRQPGRK